MQNDTTIQEIDLGNKKSSDNSYLCCIIHRNDYFWSLAKIDKFGEGKVFTECEDLVRNNLKLAGFDEMFL